MKEKTEFVEDMPKHVSTFLHALEDLDDVLTAHGRSLFDGLPEMKKEVSERETMFSRAAVTLLCAAWEAYIEDLALNSQSAMIAGIK